MTDSIASQPEPALDGDAILAQLDRILASEHFDASERNQRFLRYVVEECLAGRAQQIKAYCIAVSVFRRDPGFDPQSDPIVRLEAGRLRRSLEHYYLTAGRDDPIRIVVPKGGYAPRFEVMAPPPAPVTARPAESTEALPRPATRRPVFAAGFIAALLALGAVGLLAGMSKPAGMEDALALSPAPSSTPSPIPSAAHPPAAIEPAGIIVAPFLSLGSAGGGNRDAAALAAVLTDEVVNGLVTRTPLAVRWDPPKQDGTANQDVVLGGSLQARDDGLRLLVHLTDRATGNVLWSDEMDGPLPPGGLAEAPQALASRIVTALADPQGPALQAVAARLHGRPATVSSK